MPIVYVASIIIPISVGILILIFAKKTPHLAWIFVCLALAHIAFTKYINVMNLPMLSLLPEIAASTLILGGIFFINRTFKQHNQNIGQLKSLCDIDRVMLSSLSHKGILNAIVDKLTATLHSDAAGILTIKKNVNNKHGYELSTFTAYNLSKKLQQYIQSRSNGFVSTVIDNLKPLVISKIDDDEDEQFLKTLRSEGFVSYMAAPIIVKGRIPIGVLTLYSTIPRRYTKREIEFINAMSSQIALALDRIQLIERIQEMSFESVRALVEAIEIRDPYTRGHSLQVADLASKIGAALGFNERELTLLEFAGLLHDVGKIAVSEKILKKKDKLTLEEWKIIRKHPLHSVRIIEPVQNLEPLLDWILYHHERWDGEGYPDGRIGADIPLQSRILAVCDTYSAMIGDRPYRKSLTVEQAKQELERVAGAQLDPTIVDLFLKSDPSKLFDKFSTKSDKFKRNVESISKALNVPSQQRKSELEYQLRFL